jgi:hypothetical protein
MVVYNMCYVRIATVWLGICSTTKLYYHYIGTGLVMPRLPHVGQANCNMVRGLHKAVQKTFVYREGCRWLFTTCVMCELQIVWLGICSTTKKQKKILLADVSVEDKKGNDLLT